MMVTTTFISMEHGQREKLEYSSLMRTIEDTKLPSIFGDEDCTNPPSPPVQIRR